MNLEQAVFFGIAKAIRTEQEKRIKDNKELAEYFAALEDSDYNKKVRETIYKDKAVSMYIHIDINDAHWGTLQILGMQTGKDFGIKKFYAVCYKLQEQGLIKIHKGHRGLKTGSKTKVSLDTKGINYIKQLKGAK